MKWKSFLIDVAITLAFIGVIFGSVYAYSGVRRPLVVVVSNSMIHSDMNVGMTGVVSPGDLILVKGVDAGDIITYEDAAPIGYKTYGDFGDVIIYRPNGADVIPVIHRAIRWVEKGEAVNGWEAPHSGFITKGDNSITNRVPDQETSICYHKPVKPEWVIGVAKGEIPWLGLISLLVSDREALADVPVIIWVFMIIELAVIFVILDLIDRFVARLKRGKKPKV
jgi:hypothetical protein